MRLFLRLLLWVCVGLVVLAVAGVALVWRLSTLEPRRNRPAPAAAVSAPVEPMAPSRPAQAVRAPSDAQCLGDGSFAAATADNAVSLTGREWAPWGRPERGWEIYLPLIAHEIGSDCAPSSQGFAAALARWQAAHALPADGILSPPTFETMRVVWLRRRPFVAAMAKGQCPPGADEASLEAARPAEGYATKPISLRPAALAAYRALVEAARRENAAIAADPRLLTIFSGYRAPAADEARCDLEQSCGTITRARCSAHRTGLAVDLFVGAAPGSKPESSDDANRLFQSQGEAYRWLVANGARFGFVNYPFEPWHWEWTGETVASPR